LHSSVSSVCGQASPPKLASLVCVRERILEPGPHDVVQLDQSVSPSAQEVMTQFSGHWWPLHVCVSYL
jgi:hypothetical protein